MVDPVSRVAGFMAVLVGIPTMRLRGAYFAIAMLAFAEALKQACLEFDSITGGGNGISLPIFTNYYFFYYAMLASVLLMVGVTIWFEKSIMSLSLAPKYEGIRVAMSIFGATCSRLRMFWYPAR